MVEMNETASIINNISSRSLIILDEIVEALLPTMVSAFAWSIAEHLHQSPFQPKTLFATHYSRIE
jgi:DNA mismatch repair protein MutS